MYCYYNKVSTINLSETLFNDNIQTALEKFENVKCIFRFEVFFLNDASKNKCELSNLSYEKNLK
jgi:hypothetical protein